MNAEQIINAAREILMEFVQKFPEEMDGRDGGHLVIQRIDAWGYKHSKQIRLNVCDVSLKKFNSFRINATEKAKRLREQAIKNGHISSWQSRDFDNKKYGGAIVAGNWILSFSGLPEKMDEYLMIKVAIKLGLFSETTDVNDIMSISKNTYEG